jgi:replicative DNA helicase
MTEQQQLADLDVEAALVSEALRRYDRYVARGLSPADFWGEQNKLVLEACAAVWDRGDPVSVGSVALELQRRGLKVGAYPGERGVAEFALNGAAAVPDADRLRELARLRAVVDVSLRAALQAQQQDLSGALATLAEVDQLGASKPSTRTGGDLVDRVLSGLRNPEEFDQRRVYLGLPGFDRAIGKLPVGSMLVVAADSNVGKSLVALELLVGCAEANVSCGLISLEDPEDITASRLLARYTQGISSRQILQGRVSADPNVQLDLSGAAARVKRLGDRLLFEDCTGESELEVCAAMSRIAARGGKLVVVDYVQEIEASKKQQDRRNEVRWVAKRLKTHAKRLGVVLVLVSQIARPKDGDEFKPPSKHALKESGDLVNAAEAIVVLWREYAADDAPIFARLQKGKSGGLGLTWEMRRNTANGALVEP